MLPDKELQNGEIAIVMKVLYLRWIHRNITLLPLKKSYFPMTFPKPNLPITSLRGKEEEICNMAVSYN